MLDNSSKNQKPLYSDQVQNISSNQKLKVKITGHLKGSYSLAIVNRDFALALDKFTNLDVYVEWNEFNPDFEYNINYLKDFPRLIELIEKSKSEKVCDVEIRNVWPILQTPSTSKMLIDYVAWEESKLPNKLVNEYGIFDEFFTISNFVKKAFEDSGVRVPITNMGQGIDEVNSNEVKKIKLKSDKITFLHISSGLPRKGVNDLIDSFINAFGDRTDVVLIIKTYPNPQNTVNSHLGLYPKQKNIKHLCEDYSKEQLENLYSIADVFVSPSKGEGFNRPVAEAMIRNIPVIVTGWSGQMDFCTDKNSVLIKYRIEESTSHLSGDKSSWAIIDKEDLKSKLIQIDKDIHYSSVSLLNQVNIAREDCKKLNNWKSVALKVEEYLVKNVDKYLKLGVLTTWKTKCGIATHSEALLPTINNGKIKTLILGNVNSEVFGNDDSNVIRCWDEKNLLETQHDEILKVCLENKIDHLLIEYHPGQHKFASLMKLIKLLGESNIKSTLEVHSTIDFKNLIYAKESNNEIFQMADKYIKTYIVHNKENILDINNFIESSRIKVVQVGYNDLKEIDKTLKENIKEILGLKGKKIIATHGFMIPHKGYDLLAEALNLLKENDDYIFLNVSAFSDGNSQSIIANQQLDDIIKKNRLANRYIHISSFLTQEQIYILLSLSDIIIFPYKKNNESASGAVRNALLTDLPVIVSNEKVFDDIREYVITLDSIEPRVIAETVMKHINDKKLTTINERKEYISNNLWSEKMKEILNTIYNE